ncbi:MAG: peptide chain release factor-like protein [Planctomycetes bacterium]|nr:peptide chain release factor-like protein [Planctomycetota bacterium]
MNLNERFGVSPSKVKELREKLRKLKIDPRKIQEQFVRGGGPGGQKINKSANAVVLRYDEFLVRCQRDRRRTVNRFLALRELVEKVEMKRSPETSGRRADGLRRQAATARAGRRARAHHRKIRQMGEEE